MYIIIPAASPDPYRQLKSISFAPEVDLTLSSLPVNEFRADIITEDSIEAGSEAILKDDMDQLWADYTITKAERVSKQCVRIVAQSYLTLMDRWKLPAEMFQNVKVPQFIEWLFRIPASGYLYTFDIDVDPYFNDITVTGFCPEQTARERLQWLCVTVGAVVRQCFSEALQFIPAPDVDATAYYAKGALIPISDTFIKPSVTIRELMRSVAVTGYENFTNVDPTPQPEEGMEPGDEPVQVIQWESSVDDQGVTWWYNPVDLLFENDESPELPGRQVSIDGVTLIGESSRQVIGWLSAAYFRRGEIRMDVINNAQYYPGQKVRVYADEDTIYTGYIQSCDFRFGLQASATLTISSNLEKVPSGKLTISYRYGDLLLGRTQMVLPDGEPYDMENPIIGWTEGGRYVEYTPTTPRTTGTGDAVVQYVPLVPVRIKIVKPPDRLAYMNDMNINYTGMLVRAIDNRGEPWTQGGLFQDGYIPLRYLTLPEKKTDIRKTEGGIRESDLNILPSVAPVISGTYCCRIIDPVAHNYRPDYRYKYEYQITGGLLTANARKNPDGTFHGFFRYIMAADSPDAIIEYTETKVNGEVAEHGTYHPRHSYTYRKKTVWYSSGGEAIVYDDIIYDGPWTAHVTPMSSGDPVAPTAWTMIYGDVVDGVEKIPVQWNVPGTNQTFEDHFELYINMDPNAPARMTVTALPKKLEYYDGDQIDYTGMVVTLYDADGNPCTNGGIYPNGIVPIEALELPKIAYKDKTDVVNLLCVGLKTSQQITASFEITIKANPYPVHIDVTTPPNKLTYQDGGDIDYSGMVVTGYDRHGAVWGNVPMKMLTLPKKASWANAGIQFHDNLEVGTSFIYWMNNWWKTDDAYSNIVIAKEFVIENGYLAYFFYDGWSMRSISVVACSAFNNAEMYQFDIYDDGRRELNKTYKLTSQKTTDDKTVYYTDYEISGVYRSNSIGPYNNEYAGWSNVASIAWRMFYGETAENRIQVIPVTIEDPIKNRVIKSAFNITVMP